MQLNLSRCGTKELYIALGYAIGGRLSRSRFRLPFALGLRRTCKDAVRQWNTTPRNLSQVRFKKQQVHTRQKAHCTSMTETSETYLSAHTEKLK